MSQLPYPRIRESADGEAAFGEGCLYADDTVLLAESEGMLQRIVDEFNRVCKRRKLKVNAVKAR